MDRETKKQISRLERRILTLESVIDGFVSVVNNSQYQRFGCDVCGHDPSIVDVCGTQDCPHGLDVDS